MTSINPLNVLKLLLIVFSISALLVVLLFAYTYLGTITGFFEWKDSYHVRHYKLWNGLTLQATVETRLQALGINKRITWSASCYGPSAIVTACTNSDDYPWGKCLGFEYYHGKKVCSANPLAAQVVPELESSGGHYGIALDHVKLKDLK